MTSAKGRIKHHGGCLVGSDQRTKHIIKHHGEHTERPDRYSAVLCFGLWYIM